MMDQDKPKTVAYANSNRIGKFQILYSSLEDGGDRPMLLALFGLCVVLEAGEHESGRGKEYIAASDLFEPLKEGEEIPEYRINFTAGVPFADAAQEARKLSSGAYAFVAVRKIIIRVPPAQLRASTKAPVAH
jgi:hypothetical protein